MSRNQTSVAFVAGIAFGGLLLYGVQQFRQNRRSHISSTQKRQQPRDSKDAIYLGIDIGGTTVAVCLTNNNGDVLAHVSRDHSSDKSPEAILATILSLTDEVVKDANLTRQSITAAGVGVPGSIDAKSGTVLRVANLPSWRDVPLTSLISSRIGAPCYVQNDAKAAALGEWWARLNKGERVTHFVMVTVGTGLGGAIISDGKLISGASGMAGEIGHSIIERNGRFSAGTGVGGILELYSSASAIVAQAQEHLRDPSVAQTTSMQRDHLSCKTIFEHAQRGDALAARLVAEMAEYIGLACINICRHVDPEMIVLTGGVMQAGDKLLLPVREAFLRHHWTIQTPFVQIMGSALGNKAGCVGASAVAKIGLTGSIEN